MRNVVFTQRSVLFSLGIFLFCAISTANSGRIRLQEHEHQPRVSKSDQKLFLGLLSGKFPSFSTTGPALDPQTICQIKELIGKDDLFQSFHPGHMLAVQKCTDLLTGDQCHDFTSIWHRAVELEPQINSQVWINCFLGMTISSPSMEGFAKPVLVEITPGLFIPPKFIELASTSSQANIDKCLDETIGVQNGIENRLWYFREDIMVNSQHLYWHLIHTRNTRSSQPLDRRGELFYYFHQSMLARYNSERLSNDLPNTIPLRVKSKTIIEEPYYPYLSNPKHASSSWSSREPNQKLDFRPIPTFVASVSAAIIGRKIKDVQNRDVDLGNVNGINILGDTVERYYSPTINTSEILYGRIHNSGHEIIATITDDEKNGVMGDPGTAMRDIVFYRWHAFVNTIFDNHKTLLPRYSPFGGDIPLVWKGVHVTSIRISSANMPDNNMGTFWSQKKFDISRSLDSKGNSTSKPAHVCVKHLDHQPFDYSICIENENIESQSATIRIFLAPTYNVDGCRFSMEDQRKLFFVLDTFPAELNQGSNLITRNSKDSSLTQYFSKTFEELLNEIESGSSSHPECGCGWPHHLLIPKGTENGLDFDLFVMVTNGEEDSVESSASKSEPQATCRQPYIYCGIRDQNQKYPDKKPMGFPFDRLPPISNNFPGSVQNLDEYVSLIPNSKSIEVTITHTNAVYTK